MSDFTAHIRAELDLSKVESQIATLRDKNIALRNIQIDAQSVVSQLQNAINGAKLNINLGGNGEANKVKDSFNDLLRIAQRISKTEVKIRGLGDRGSAGQVTTLRNQLEELWSDYNKVQQSLGKGLTVGQQSNINAVFGDMASKLKELDAKFADTRAKLAENIQFKIDTGQISSAVQEANKQFSLLEEKPAHVQANMQRLNAAFLVLNSSASMDDKIRAMESYERILPVVTRQLSQVARAQADVTQTNAQILSNNIDAWMNKNAKAAQVYGDRLQELKTRLANVKSPADLKKIATDFKLVQSEAKASGLIVSDFGQRISSTVKQMLGLGSAAMVFRKIVQVGKKMLEEVKAVDSAMVELKKVTDEAASTYDAFQKRVGKNAQKIGTSMSDLITSTADFARLGYSMNEAEGLAQVANVYAVVGDEIDGIDEASKSLISTMQAFKGEMTDAMSNTDFAYNIIDKFNEVGNNYAISSGGIGDALERSASSLAAANNTLDESIALITAANTVVQNPESIGTAYKTITMRIRGAKTELEEAGLETDGMVASTAKLQAEIKALSGVDIMKDKNTFKSTYQILDELSAKWEELTDIQQASITELLAGKRQGNIVSSLMRNFDTARAVLETSSKSAGSAMKEHATWMQSVDAKSKTLKASWQELSTTFMNTDAVKGAYDGLIKLTNGITKLVDKIGGLPVALGAGGALAGLLNFGKLKQGFASIKKFGSVIADVAGAAAGGGIKSLGDLGAAFSLVEEGSGLAAGSIAGFLGVLGGVGVILAFVAALDWATTSYKEARSAWEDSAKAYEESVSKISSVESELNDVNKQIEEINSKEKIDPVDREALDKLNKTKLRLEEQLALEKKLANYRQATVAKDAKRAIDTGGSDAWDWQSMFGIKGVEDRDFMLAGAKASGTGTNGQTLWSYDQITETSVMQNAIDRLTKERQELEDSYRQYVDSMTESEQKANRDRVAKIDDLLGGLGESVSTNMTELSGYLDTITDADGNALKGYEDYVFRIEQLQHQITGMEVDPLDDAIAHVKEFQRLGKEQNWDSTELRHYLGVLSGEDLSTAPIERVKEVWKELHQEIGTSDWNAFSFLKGNETEGLQRFWEAVQSINKEWASFDEKTGEWKINITSVEELAEALGLSEDLVQSIIQKTSQNGIQIDTTPVDNMRKAVMDTSEAIKTLKSSDMVGDFSVNLDVKTVEEAETEMSRIQKILLGLRDEKGKINIDSAEGQAAYTLLSQLYDKKIELANNSDITFHITTDGIGDDKVKNFIVDVNNAKIAIQELQKGKQLKAEGFDIDVKSLRAKAEEAVGTVQTSFAELPADKKINLSINETGIDQEHLGTTLSTLQAISKTDVTVALGIDPSLVEGYNPADKEAEVKFKANYEAVKTSTPPKKTGTVTYVADYSNISPGVDPRRNRQNQRNGTQGFQGNAHAGGRWGAPRSTEALVGELGREILVDVHTGRWHTIGDNGAEFTHIPKDAIIFNHKQTEELLKYGHINSRGLAFAGGNAFADYGVHGQGKLGNKPAKDNDKPTKNNDKPAKDAAKDVKDATQNIKKDIEDTKKVAEAALEAFNKKISAATDWVEKVLENINKKTEKYLANAEKKAEAGNYSGAAKLYQRALDEFDKSIGKHGNAENLYMQHASKVLQLAIEKGVINQNTAASIEYRVANGKMDINSLGEGTKAVVEAYKQYYDKAVAVQDATQDLYDKYEEVAKKMYQLPLDQAAAKTDKIKNAYDILDKKLEVVYNKTTQVSLIEQKMANVRQQHAAQMQAYTQAHENYLTAERKINESSDKALKGLSDSVIKAINDMVKAGEVIDYTELTGLTETAKLAIIDYNAALTAQSQALYDSTASMLDTIATLRELSEEKYGKPAEKAEEEIANREKYRGVRDAEYEIAETAKEKNTILTKHDTQARADRASREREKEKTEQNMQLAWGNVDLQEMFSTSAGFDLEYGKKISGKQLKAAAKELGYKKGSDEYNALMNAVIEYNDAVDADKDAALALAKQKAETTAALQANAKTRIDNIAAEHQLKIDAQDAKINAAQSGMDALGDVMNAINVAQTPEAKQALADKFAAAYGWQIDPTKSYEENQAAGYDYLSTLQSTKATLLEAEESALQTAYEAEKGVLSQEQGSEIENQILQVRTDGLAAEMAASKAVSDATTAMADASDQALKDAQNAYETQNNVNEDLAASGKVVGKDNWQATKNILEGTTDEDGGHIKGLIELTEDELKEAEETMNGLVEGTEEWANQKSKVDDLRSTVIGLKNALKDVNGELEETAKAEAFGDHLDEVNHNATMQEAKQGAADAIGNAIGGALGGGGGNWGQLIGQMLTAVAVGGTGAVAIGKNLLDEINNPEGFNLSNFLTNAGASMSEIYRTMTPEGIAQDKRQALVDQVEYYKNNPKSEDDEGYKQWLADYRAAEEELARFDEEQAQKTADAMNSAAGGVSDAVNEARKMIADMMHRRTNMIKLKLADIEGELKRISSDMAMTEARGLETNYDQLIEQIKATNKEIEVYEKELIPQLKREEAFTESDDDRSASEKLQDHQAVLDAEAQLEDLKLESFKLQRIALRDKILDPLTKAHEEVERMRDVLVGIDDLITDDMLFDAEGQISRNGQARLDMLIGQYRAAEAEVQNFKDEIDALNNFRNNGLFSNIELDKMIAEAQGKLLDAEKDRVDLALKYIDIVKQAGEEELETLNDIIDARQDALQAKKDYYDYDKTIRGKTKDIQALQAQIAALEGLTDAESKAKRARLEADLAEAQEDLDDTIQQHMFEISSDSLDKLSDTLEEAHEDEWKEITGDLEKLLAYVDNINTSVGNDQIDASVKEVLREIGIQFKEIDGQEVDATQFATIFQSAFDKVMDERYDDATKQQVFDALRQIYPQMVGAGLWYGSYQELATPEEEALAAAGKTDNNTPMDKPPEVTLSFWERLLQWLKDIFNAIKDAFNKIGSWFNDAFGNIGSWFKNTFKFPGFATGTRSVAKTGAAWTHKDEWIVRKSDGGILTPLSKGDGVLPADITNRLYQLAQGNLPQMQMPKMQLPDYNIVENYSPNITIDSSIHVEGSVDAAVISDLKKFRDDMCEDAYRYTSEKMYRGYMHSGGRRRI